MKLTKMRDQISKSSNEVQFQDSTRSIANELILGTQFQKVREAIKTADDLFNIGNIDIRNLTHAMLEGHDLTGEDGLRSLLALAATTQDVNFLLKAMHLMLKCMTKELQNLSITSDSDVDTINQTLMPREYDLI